MAIADIIMSSDGKVTIYHGYTLYKFGTNWLSFVENITILLHYVNLSHSFSSIKPLNICTTSWLHLVKHLYNWSSFVENRTVFYSMSIYLTGLGIF